MPSIACTLCETNQAIMMSTSLDDGQTMNVCPEDMLLYSLTLAANATIGMTEETAEAFSELLDQIYANDPRSRKPAKKTGRRAATVSPELAPDALEGGGTVVNTVALLSPCAECGGTEGIGDADKLACSNCGAIIATADEIS